MRTLHYDQIYNENCLELMAEMTPHSVDVVLTSPPYNTNKKCSTTTNTRTVQAEKGIYTYARYDGYNDNLTNEDYCEFIGDCFKNFDKVLKNDGVILWNMSYGNENADALFLSLNKIISLGFTVADILCWKKKSAMPINQSKNKATRICEYVFVICRTSEQKSFHANKRITSLRPTGQKMYECFENFIEAPNNDGVNALNKAAFSTELCTKLLKIYAPENALVYDPFMGTGTTANACIKMGFHFLGSEISKEQCDYANERIKMQQTQVSFL